MKNKYRNPKNKQVFRHSILKQQGNKKKRGDHKDDTRNYNQPAVSGVVKIKSNGSAMGNNAKQYD